jgi:hypothetical protein
LFVTTGANGELQQDSRVAPVARNHPFQGSLAASKSLCVE